MRVRFEPLTRCDVDGCDALVEPRVGRCGRHRTDNRRRTEKADPFTGSPPKQVVRARWERERERARRPAKGGVK